MVNDIDNVENVDNVANDDNVYNVANDDIVENLANDDNVENVENIDNFDNIDNLCILVCPTERLSILSSSTLLKATSTCKRSDVLSRTT